MNIFSEKNKSFLLKYKWLILPGIPLLFFIFLSVLVLTSETGPQTVPDQIISPTPMPFINETNTPKNNNEYEGIEESLDRRQGLEKKEPLPDGTTRYIFPSQVKDRPNIFIAKTPEDVLFQRTVTLPGFPVKITDYTESYGNAKWIFKGSNFYGPDAQTYIYPELGVAFIGNPKTNEVYEQHVFTPTNIDEYVRKYGEDIPG